MFGVLKRPYKLVARTCGILLVPLLTFCSNEFDPSAEAEGIPVVYGIINPKDSIYCIKLTRSFTCSEDAVLCSMDPQNLYYQNPQIALEVLTDDGRLLDRGELHSITIPDSDTTKGLFHSEYKTIYTINRNEITLDNWSEQRRILILKIYIPEYSKLVLAKTTISQPFELLYPRKDPNGTRLDFFTSEGQSIIWRGPENEYFDGKYVFHYTDFLYPDSSIHQSVNFRFKGPAPIRSSVAWATFSFRLYGQSFLDSIARCFQKIPKVENLMFRKFDSLDIELSSATYEYYEYIQSLNHDSDVEIPKKYNIENGYGIFAITRNFLSTGNYLNHNCLDSLVNSKKTRWIQFIIWE